MRESLPPFAMMDDVLMMAETYLKKLESTLHQWAVNIANMNIAAVDDRVAPSGSAGFLCGPV